MVDFARVQNRIYYGYTKASIRLGTTHGIYRPVSAFDPIQTSTFFENQLISIDQDLTYVKSRKYGDMSWYFLPFDGLALQNYDYMVGQTVTYFIADVAPEDRLSPPLCTECNTLITILRPENTASPNVPLKPGLNSYQQFLNPLPVATNVPVAILQHTRSDSANMRLPTSVKLPMYQITMPEFPNFFPLTGDIITDDKDRRMSVINAEITKRSLGVRILAQELAT